MMDFILPPRRNDEDESLGELIARRLGSEVLENLTEPLLSGMYGGDIQKISLQATFPQFGELEQQYGSLIRGMRTGRKNKKAQEGTTQSTFLTFRKGLQSLVHSLIYELHDVEQRTESNVVSIQAAGSPSIYEVELENGERLLADDVYITAPNFSAADLLRPYMDVTALEAVDYVSVANLVMAFNKKDIVNEYDGSGFLCLVKKGEILLPAHGHLRNETHTAPDDKVLLRCYVGRSDDEQNVQLPGEALTELVLKDLREIMGITANPIFTEITRLEHSMPQYPIGHLDNITEFRKELAASLPGVYVIGAGFNGIAMPDCIKQSKLIAESVAKQLMNEM